MNIRVRGASWTDPTLIKCRRFYPPGCRSAEALLRFYASQFPIVEVDSGYYSMRNGADSVLWVERTPPGFVFNFTLIRGRPSSIFRFGLRLCTKLLAKTRQLFKTHYALNQINVN